MLGHIHYTFCLTHDHCLKFINSILFFFQLAWGYSHIDFTEFRQVDIWMKKRFIMSSHILTHNFIQNINILYNRWCISCHIPSLFLLPRILLLFLNKHLYARDNLQTTSNRINNHFIIKTWTGVIFSSLIRLLIFLVHLQHFKITLQPLNAIFKFSVIHPQLNWLRQLFFLQLSQNLRFLK